MQVWRCLRAGSKDAIQETFELIPVRSDKSTDFRRNERWLKNGKITNKEVVGRREVTLGHVTHCKLAFVWKTKTVMLT